MNIYYQQPKLDLLCSQCETNINVFLKRSVLSKKIMDRVLDKFFFYGGEWLLRQLTLKKVTGNSVSLRLLAGRMGRLMT